jgi:endonuclease/exonuclease/phosphatase family metal-dependent hydrolase
MALLGDFNARLHDDSMAPLVSLPGWDWPRPALPDAAPWTTYLDREVIDHIGVSPGARLIGGSRGYAFDLDPALGGEGFFHRVDGFEAQRARGSPRAPVENLYRVSDHRPVIAEIETV